MEEDIKRIQEILKYKDDVGIPILGTLEYEVIEHLLQAYKEEVKANTDLSILNAELSFKVGEYEERLKHSIPNSVIREKIEKLAKEYSKLKEKYNLGQTLSLGEFETIERHPIRMRVLEEILKEGEK